MVEAMLNYLAAMPERPFFCLYDPPAGLIGKVVAKLFQREPAIQARRDLRRFKQLMETGEIATAARTRRDLEEEKN